MLLSADGLGTNAIMAVTAKSKTCVWRWQERFATEGVEGLLRDKPRPSGKPPVAADRMAEVVRLTLAPPPHEATHWMLRTMAKAVGMAAGEAPECGGPLCHPAGACYWIKRDI